MRPFRALAADLNVSERQFHRRLNAGDAEACLALRREVVWTNQPEIAFAVNSLNDVAELVRRCDARLAGLCEAMAVQLSEFLKVEASPWRLEHDRRLSELALLDCVSDRDYEVWAQDLEHLPPLPSEVKTKRKSALNTLEALASGADPSQPV